MRAKGKLLPPATSLQWPFGEMRDLVLSGLVAEGVWKGLDFKCGQAACSENQSQKMTQLPN